MSARHGFAVALTVGVGAAVAPGSAQAVQNLQMFIEGASYCGGPSLPACPGSGHAFEETWAKTGTDGLRLWVLADSPIYDVKLFVSYNELPGNAPTFNLYGKTIGSSDVGAPALSNEDITWFPTNSDPNFDINNPLHQGWHGFSDGAAPADILYPAGFTLNGSLTGLQVGEQAAKTDPTTRDWVVVDLGDLTAEETFLGDTAPPKFRADGAAGVGESSGANNFGEIRVYDLVFLAPALAGQVVNFDLWGCSEDVAVCGSNDFVNGSNSHDAQWLQQERIPNPEPATLGVLGAGLLGLTWLRRRRNAAS